MLRLRQVCLVARELEPVVEDMRAILGIEVAHRDPSVAAFGLHNAVLPVGDTFLEVVAPTRPDTTAGRYLNRRGGDGGYMVILDTDALDPWRDQLAAQGVRIAADLVQDGYRGLQLHPRDTGGALLEINWSPGWETGAYHPAGLDWRAHVRTERVRAITGVTLQSSEPGRLTTRWHAILGRSAQGTSIELDHGRIAFAEDSSGRGEGLAALTLAATDAGAVRATAAMRGCMREDGAIHVGGVRIDLA